MTDTPQRLDGSRPSCPECVFKHLTVTLPLADEYTCKDPDGSRPYRHHFMFIYGHLMNAEEESDRDFPQMKMAIRSLRQRLWANKQEGLPVEYHVPSSEDIEEILMAGGFTADAEWIEDEFMEEDELYDEEPLPLVDVVETDEDDFPAFLKEDPVEEVLEEESIVDSPSPRAEVNYKPISPNENQCQNCQAWLGQRPGSIAGRCELINDSVLPKGSCSFFEEKKN